MKKLLLIACGLAIAAAVEAQIIHVPGDYPTIQQGIEAATNGDTVLVSDGIYYEQINFLGKKPLMVASQFIIDGDTNHIASTIIDGSQITNLDSASVVYFISGEDTTSVLAGITLQHGKGTLSAPGLVFRGGGGVYIAQSGAKIIYSHITQNHLSDTISGNATIITGAGIHYKWEENDNWVVIDHNVIDHNSCYSSGAEAGSVGADIASNTRITYNTFSDNAAIGAGNCHAVGAGFCCWTDPSWNDTVIAYIQHNVIKDNLSSAQNSFANSAGGFISAIIGIFTDNIVENNQVIVNNNPSGGAAGIYVLRPLEGTVVCNSTFRENNCNKFGGALCVESYASNPNVKMVLVENNYFLDNHANDGGAFVSFYNPVNLQNNVFNGNNAVDNGGAVYLYKPIAGNIPHLATFINNSFFGNKTGNNGGAICSINAKPLIFNSIFLNDSANIGQEIYVIMNDTAEIAYSNINPDYVNGNMYDGGGNINENPLFEDLELLTISENSPCVNTGIAEYICHCNNLHTAPAYDIIGNLRPLNGNFDMGAYEEFQGQVIRVPADYPTIQQGIEAANNGDTVLVSDGTYYEQINFLGKKPLIVASEFLMDGDTNHIANTIIDGSQLTKPDSASVVYFISGEDTTSVLCGFTIRNGKGTSCFWEEYESIGGGGIHISFSTANIRNNIIRNNEVNDTLSTVLSGSIGGGIYAAHGTPGWVIIENNKIFDNKIISNHEWTEGGGAYIYCTNARVTNNQIRANLSKNTGYGYGAAGGLHCGGDGESVFIEVVIRNNLIENNEVRAVEYGFGGGMGLWFPADGSVIQNNTISYNVNDWIGGGIDMFSGSLTTFKIENNYFIGNEALNGGAIDVDYDSTSQVLLINNVFSQNKAYNQGGAIWINRSNNCPVEHMLVSVNNSFYDNHADLAGGAIYTYEDNPVVINSIFWQNPDLSGDEITVESGYTELAYSNIDTNLITGDKVVGEEIIFSDPIFDDLDLLTLSELSPCINKGTESFTCQCGTLLSCPEHDIIGISRPQNGLVDMGAYEIVLEGIWDHPLGNAELRHSINPNPFNDQAVLSYELEQHSFVDIFIYNNSGELIQTLLSEQQEAGNQELQFSSGNLPAGIYFYRITTDSKQATGRMIILK